MKTLSQLIQEAIPEIKEIINDDWELMELNPGKHYRDGMKEVHFIKLKVLFEKELIKIVKESFKNTETVGEDHKLEITKQGEIDTSKTHWATYGYRAALSDTKIKQNQFLNN